MKSATLTFGRFNPPTSGHEVLVQRVISVAKGSEHRIYASQSHDPKSNPLPYRSKVKYLKKAFPYANIMMDPRSITVFHALKSMSDDGYTDVTLVVGSDRVKEFDRAIKRYIGHPDPKKAFNFDKFKVVSAGQRDPDAEGVSGMSASKMRKFVKDKDIKSFLKGIPSKMRVADGKAMYNELRKSMSIVEDVEIDINEQMNLFEISMKGRRNIARAAKRTAKKRQKSRERKKKIKKNADQLKKLAQKAAREKVKKKIIRDRNWNSMSPQEKEKVEKKIDKKKAVIKKLTTKLLPSIRKKETERIAKLRGKNENNTYNSNKKSGAGEDGTDELLKNYMKQTPYSRRNNVQR